MTSSMLKSIERCNTENLDVNKEALTAAMESLVAKLQAKSEQLMIVRRQLYLRKNEKMEDARNSRRHSPEKDAKSIRLLRRNKEKFEGVPINIIKNKHNNT